MVEKAKLDQKKKLDEEAEQAAAKDEPMGSVAAAVPRDEGSAASHDAASHDKDASAGCDEHPAPPHEGGHATLVAGSEAHKAEEPDPKQKRP
jgi:hypothetical protein